MNTIGRVIVGAAALANAWLLYTTIWATRLRGAGSAQGDMEVFLYVVSLGSAVIVISLLHLFTGFLVNVKTIRFDAALLRRPVVLTSLLNISIAAILLVYVFSR